MKTNNPLTRLLKGAALVAALTAGLTSTSRADLINGGFESGLSGWAESGGSGLFSTPASLTGFYDSIVPPEASHFGLISNNGVDAETISQTFTITDGSLVFSARLFTDEYNTGADYNDEAHVTLTINGVPTALVSISRDDLQAGGEGSLLAGAEYIDNTEHGYDIAQDAWHTYSFDVSSHIGESATLSFTISNINDSTLDIGVSQLGVDNVHLATTAVPEPGQVSLAVALGLVGLVAVRIRTKRRLNS